MAKIVEIHGNIFNTNCQVIVNTVNCMGIMGRGIALEFKNRFPDMYSTYKKYCDEKLLKPGVLQLYSKNNPWILNFPTKRDWKLPSKLEYVELGLKKFASTYEAKNIYSIAFPKLGTESGGLDWNEVKNLMYFYLEPLKNLDVEIYHFDPNTPDNLFIRFNQKVSRFEISDYKKIIGLTNKQSTTLYKSFNSGSVKTMLDIQNISGIGEKALEKLYAFINSDQQFMTYSEQNPKLF